MMYVCMYGGGGGGGGVHACMHAYVYVESNASINYSSVFISVHAFNNFAFAFNI